MTYSNGLKSVVSDYGTTDEVVPRKPSIKNLSLSLKGRFMPKDFLKGSLQGTTSNDYATTSEVGGGRYDYKRISAFQSSKMQSGCEDCNSEDRFSLQVQYQLPYNMDSEVSEKSIERQGG